MRFDEQRHQRPNISFDRREAASDRSEEGDIPRSLPEKGGGGNARFHVGIVPLGTILLNRSSRATPKSARRRLFFLVQQSRSRGEIGEATSLPGSWARAGFRDYLSLLRRIDPPPPGSLTSRPSTSSILASFTFCSQGTLYSLQRHPIDTCLSMYSPIFKGRHSRSPAKKTDSHLPIANMPGS